MNRKELKETFDHFDSDGNGSIDRQEFGDLLDALGADMSPEELDMGFEIIDTDASGQVDFQEFADWWDQR